MSERLDLNPVLLEADQKLKEQSGPADALRAAAYTLVQAPVDSVAQMASHASGQKLEAPKLLAAPSKADGWTTAGVLAGTLVQFIAVSKALRGGLNRTGLTNPAAPTKFWEAGLSGAAVDVLHPVSSSEKDFWTAKARGAGVAFGTFSVMTGTSNLLSEASFVRRVGRRGVMENMAVHGFTGTMGGATNAELDAIFRGQLLPDAGKLASRVVEFAAFGAAFGGIEALAFRPKLELKPAKDGKTGEVKAPSSEQWIKDYDGANPMESPLLTWIAETRPHLRPPGYEAFKKSVLETPSTQLKQLDLAAWPVEQRPALLAEIRNLASGTQLAKDANIDAFISRMNVPELKAYSHPTLAGARENAHQRWAEASGRLEKLIEADPALREMHWSRMTPELGGKRPDLVAKVDEVMAAEKSYQELVRKQLQDTKVEEALTRAMNDLARDAGLPQLNGVKVNVDHREGWYNGEHVGFGERALNRGLSGNAAETGLHEMVHHDYLPGFFRSLFGSGKKNSGNPVGSGERISEELARLKQPGGTLDLLKRLGDAETRTAQNVLAGKVDGTDIRYYVQAAREGQINTDRWNEAAINKALETYLNFRLAEARLQAQTHYLGYVGSYIEQPAWAAGFLTRIRSRALGLPDPHSSLEAKVTSFSEFQPKLR